MVKLLMLWVIEHIQFDLGTGDIAAGETVENICHDGDYIPVGKGENNQEDKFKNKQHSSKEKKAEKAVGSDISGKS